MGLVARLDHWGKGHRELFTALAGLTDRYPLQGPDRRRRPAGGGAAAIGGGAGPGAAGCISSGQRRDIPDLLAALDILVLPSHSEGVSLALLEAMAAGLPVIATAVGGLPEVVTDGVNGLLIPPRDPEALARALDRLLADPDFARRLGEQARAEVEAHYSLERLGRGDQRDLRRIKRQPRALAGWGR